MSINTGYENFINYNFYNSESDLDKTKSDPNNKINRINLKNCYKPKSDPNNKTKSINLKNCYKISEVMPLDSSYKISEAMDLDSTILYRITNFSRKYLSPDEYEKITIFFQEHLPPNSANHLEPFDFSKLSSRHPGKLEIEKSLLQKIIGGIDEIIKNATSGEAAVINHPSEKSPLNNNKKRTEEVNPLGSSHKISEAMGLDSKILYQIKINRKRYLSPDEYEKIKEFFQERLSPNSPNHLEPFVPSMLSDINPGKVSIERSLHQKIMGGVKEIIENETQDKAPVHKNFKAAVINHPPEKSASNNNMKRIDLAEEENPFNQEAVEHVSKKAKTILNDRQPCPFYQDAIPMYQSFFLEEALPPTQEATTTSPIEDETEYQPSAPEQTAFPVDDDLFYNIPEDELFLPAEPVQTSPTNPQASSTQGGLFLTFPYEDDLFPLESTWDNK